MKRSLIIGFCLFAHSLIAQTMTWSDISSQYQLPESVRLYAGTQIAPHLKAWYLEFDLADSNYVLMPYLSESASGTENVVSFSQRKGAVAAINGGYFGGSNSFSTVITLNEVLAQNVASVIRNGQPYPVTRSLLSIGFDGKMAVDWVYHFGPLVTDVFAFSEPTPNLNNGQPVPAPQKADGTAFIRLAGAIGGGPTLVKDSTLHVTYDEEIFWGSGVDANVDNPRTAVGYTNDGRAILLVVDGRQVGSAGVSLERLGNIMLSLRCIAAMNLDGGGSTQMAVQQQLVNRPQGSTFMRQIPSFLAIVHRDSLPESPDFSTEKIIDTADSNVELVGEGWFETANPGFWGTTPSLLNERGSGDRFAAFKLELSEPGNYDLFAWWVAGSNRCTDTPFVIVSAGGRDTVRVDQSINGSKWHSLGRFAFQSDSSEAIIISNAASNGQYIAADAIRAVLQTPISAIGDERVAELRPSEFILKASHPNPFQTSTTVRFSMRQPDVAQAHIYDVRGRLVATLHNGTLPAGEHRLTFKGKNLPAGIYFCRIQIGRTVRTQKMILLAR